MKSNKLKLMTVTALLTALNIVISRILIIPIPFTHGNINLCDAGIFIIAMLYGPWPGLFAGAVSGFLLDLISGYSQYMFFSLIVHGLEGLIVGFLFQRLHAANWNHACWNDHHGCWVFLLRFDFIQRSNRFAWNSDELHSGRCRIDRCVVIDTAVAEDN